MIIYIFKIKFKTPRKQIRRYLYKEGTCFQVLEFHYQSGSWRGYSSAKKFYKIITYKLKTCYHYSEKEKFF